MPPQGHFHRHSERSACLPTHGRRKLPFPVRFYQFYPRKAENRTKSARSGARARRRRPPLPGEGARGRLSERSARLCPRCRKSGLGTRGGNPAPQAGFQVLLTVPHASTTRGSRGSEKSGLGMRGGILAWGPEFRYKAVFSTGGFQAVLDVNRCKAGSARRVNSSIYRRNGPHLADQGLRKGL